MQTIERITQRFDEVGIHYKVEPRGKVTCIKAGLAAKSVRDKSAEILINPESGDAGVYVFRLATVLEEQRERVLEVLNDLNGSYRYVRFFIDQRDSITVACDIPMTVGDIAETAVELFIRLSQIVDKSYPYIMRTMWA